jgi:hypothetical protein
MPLHVVDAYPEKSCQVSVVKVGRNVWIAAGEFMREPLSVNASSERGAVAQWKNLAEFRYELGRKQRLAHRRYA